MAKDSPVYRLNPAIAIEDFGQRALALHCVDLRLVELNATARDLVYRLDGRTDLDRIATSVAEDYAQDLETVLADLWKTTAQMAKLDVIERVYPTLEQETSPHAARRLYKYDRS